MLPSGSVWRVSSSATSPGNWTFSAASAGLRKPPGPSFSPPKRTATSSTDRPAPNPAAWPGSPLPCPARTRIVRYAPSREIPLFVILVRRLVIVLGVEFAEHPVAVAGGFAPEVVPLLDGERGDADPRHREMVAAEETALLGPRVGLDLVIEPPGDTLHGRPTVVRSAPVTVMSFVRPNGS